MKYLLQFHPDVEEDLASIYSWYEQQTIGLGENFLQSFYYSVELITKKPKLYVRNYGEYRRCLLHKFPYSIYYKINEKSIVIMGCFHYARDPKKLKAILQKRV